MAKPVTKMKLSMVFGSGIADELLPLGMLAQAAAAMNYDVNKFVMGAGLFVFYKTPVLAYSKETSKIASKIKTGLKKNKVPGWQEMLGEAKSLGAKIYACSQSADIIGVNKKGLNNLIDGVICPADFLIRSEGGEILFL